MSLTLRSAYITIFHTYILFETACLIFSDKTVDTTLQSPVITEHQESSTGISVSRKVSSPVTVSPPSGFTENTSLNDGWSDTSHPWIHSTEAYNQSKSGYLETIEDTELRQIVDVYMQYCHGATLCDFFPIPLRGEQCVPCQECQCTETCRDSRTCCPDMFSQIKDDGTVEMFDSNFVCKVPGITISKCPNKSNIKTRYKFIMTCPAYIESDVKSQCETPEGTENSKLSDIVAVTDLKKQKNYFNKYCAICNNVSKEDMYPWKPQILCDTTKSLNSIPLTDKLVQDVRHRDHCCIIFRPPEILAKTEHHECEKVPISECDSTDTWLKSIQTACIYKEFNIPYKINSLIYRNVFCAACNGIPPLDENSCEMGSFTEGFHFSTLLDFNFWSDETSTTDGQPELCDVGTVLDSFKGRCRDLECAQLTFLDGEKCKPMIKSTQSAILYKLHIKLFFDKQLDTDHAFHMVPSAFRQLEWYSGNYFICSQQLYYKTNITFTSANTTFSAVEILRREFLYGILELIISPNTDDLVKDQHNPNKILEDLLSIAIENFTVEYNNTQYYLFSEILVSDTWFLEKPVTMLKREVSDDRNLIQHVTIYHDPFDNKVILQANPPYISDKCPNHVATTLVLQRHTDCPLVRMRQSEYSWSRIPSGIHVDTLNWTLPFGKYFPFNDSEILVCANDYISAAEKVSLNNTRELSKDSNMLLITVSVICTSLSVVCLIISFLVYCLLPGLRTVPGKNNMMLCISLSVAQLLYFILNIGIVGNGWLCTAVGIAVHFCWLTAIAWMGICCFHMLRVFCLITTRTGSSGRCLFLVYIFISNIFSLSFIGLNILMSKLVYGRSDIGYGGDVCYINDRKLTLFTFAIPVGFVVLCNIVMFVVVVVKLRSMPTLQKNSKHERNNFIICFKLSTLTGVTWVFGFINSFADVSVLAYIFTILTGSIGVFFMASFVCNRRVYQLLMKKRKGHKGLTSRYASNNTDSSQPTNNPSATSAL